MYNLSLKNIHEYLNLKGFILQSFDNNLDKVTITDNEESFDVLIPKKEELKDYAIRINDFIHTISSIENKDISEVFENLVNIGYDLLKFRFRANSTTEGNIPLVSYPEIIKGIGDVMLWGACSAMLQKSKYTRPYEEAKELVKHCEIGQTEKGSFVITVRVPLGEDFLNIPNEEKDEEYLKNFGRKTITQIISGINEIKSIDLNNEETFRGGYDAKLSKNACDAISGIIQADNGFNVDINAKLNTFVPSEEEIPISTKLESSSDFKRFNLVSSYLINIPEEKIMTITGIIIRLNDNPQQRIDERKLITLNDSKLKRNIYVHLTEEEYKEACKAHGDGNKIQITGLLNKKLSHWCLDNPQDFNVLSH